MQTTLPDELLQMYDRLAGIGRAMRLAGLDAAALEDLAQEPGRVDENETGKEGKRGRKRARARRGRA